MQFLMHLPVFTVTRVAVPSPVLHPVARERSTLQ